MVKFWLVSAAVFGFLTMTLGAFGAHSLKNVLDDYGKIIYERAVLYQMFHTVALLAVGILQHLFKEISFSRILRRKIRQQGLESKCAEISTRRTLSARRIRCTPRPALQRTSDAFVPRIGRARG